MSIKLLQLFAYLVACCLVSLLGLVMFGLCGVVLVATGFLTRAGLLPMAGFGAVAGFVLAVILSVDGKVEV